MPLVEDLTLFRRSGVNPEKMSRLTSGLHAREAVRSESQPLRCGVDGRNQHSKGDDLEQMARSLVESGDYRVTSRLEPQAETNLPITFQS